MFVTLFVSIILAAFLPSQGTIYKMLIASYITPDNLHMVQGLAKDGITYLLDSITQAALKMKGM